MAVSRIDYAREFADCEAEDLVRTGQIQSGIDFVAIGADGITQSNLCEETLGGDGLIAALSNATFGDAIGAHHHWVHAPGHGTWLHHRSDGYDVFERSGAPPDFAPEPIDCQALVAQSYGNLWKFHFQLCAATTRALRCDRAMIYRFHDDYSGEIVAEQVSGDLEPYLGLRYPPTDIPQQARAIFLRAGARCVFGTSRTTEALVARRADGRKLTGRVRPLNTEFSVSRAVSPFHIRYLRDMGSGSTAACPLICDGKLWGIVSLHFRDDRMPSCEEFAVLQQLSGDASAALADLVSGEGDAMLARAEAHIQTFRTALADSTDVFSTLLMDDTAPHRMSAADGACLVLGNRICSTGMVPDLPVIQALCDSIPPDRAAMGDFGSEFPDTVPSDGHNGVSGYALRALDAEAGAFYIVFRRSLDRQVTWGGDPRRVAASDGQDGNAPRRSFERWVENVQGQAAAWSDVERRILTATLENLRDHATASGLSTGELLARDLTGALADRAALWAHAERLIRGVRSAIAIATERRAQAPTVLLGLNQVATDALETSPLMAKSMSLAQLGAGFGVPLETLGQEPVSMTIVTTNRGIRDCEVRSDTVLSYRNLDAPDEDLRIDAHELHDVTEARRIEQALLSARDRALRQVDLRAEFFAKLSHELRTPLNAIVGISSLLVERPGSLDAKVLRRVETIYRASDHMSEVIDTALRNAECVNALKSAAIERVALHGIVTEVIAILHHAASLQNVTVENRVDPAFYCETEARALRQLLINLMSNALKYNVPNGRVVISAAERQGRFFDLSISDTGIGMTREQTENCLRPYTRYASGLGSGLGLSITNHLVAAMGGYLTISSEHGKGTRVSAQLPLSLKTLDEMTINRADIAVAASQVSRLGEASPRPAGP